MATFLAFITASSIAEAISRFQHREPGACAAAGMPSACASFAILKSSARYPSGPRERSAKPPFVGSNPTRASKLLVSNQWITTFVSFPESPTWEQLGKELFRTLNCTPMCIRNRVSVKVQRGLDSSVSQLLLRDLGGYTDIVQDGSVYVAKLMPRYSLKPCRLRSRPQHAY